MGMERLPGPVCNACRPMAIDDGTMSLSLSGTQAIAVNRRQDLGSLMRLHRAVEAGLPACWNWEDLADLRDLVHALPPSGYAGVRREELVHSLYGAIVASAADRHLDVREVGTNRGDDVEEMLEAVGRDGGDAWCSAFVSQMHRLAAEWMCGITTCPQEAAVQFMWSAARAAGVKTFTKDDVHDGAEQPRAGDVFIMARASGYATLTALEERVWKNDITSTHNGLVIGYDGSSHTVTTIEGNTNEAGGREGDGVYMRERKIIQNPGSTKVAILGFVRPGVIL